MYAWGMQEAGGDSEFDALWERYSTGTSGQERDNILYALTRSTRIWHIQRYCEAELYWGKHGEWAAVTLGSISKDIWEMHIMYRGAVG